MTAAELIIDGVPDGMTLREAMAIVERHLVETAMGE